MKSKPDKTKRPKPVRWSAWLGCGLLSIITPETPKRLAHRIEMDSDIVLGWDGKKLLMLKNRGAANLKHLSAALRCVAEAAPTAAWGSLVNYSVAPAKPHTPLLRPPKMDGSKESRSQRNAPREKTAGRASNNPPTPSQRKRRSKSDTQLRNGLKVSDSYKRGKRPNDPSSATTPSKPQQ